MHSRKVVTARQGQPLVHTNNLLNGTVTYSGEHVHGAVLTGPALLFPRVGLVTPGKLCVLGAGRRVTLSDCVLGVVCESEAEVELLSLAAKIRPLAAKTSRGGAIAQMRREGPVLVINVNTRYLSSVKNRGVVTGDVRYKEEVDAASFLGFESLQLDELDALFRRPAYASIANIFRPPVAEDIAWLPTLRERLDAVLRAIHIEQLLVPLGIGWHADHVLAHAAFTPWIGRSELVFYEDAPYCWIPHATRYRLTELAEFESTAVDGTLADAGAWQSWREASGAYAQTALMQNLRPALVRWGAVPVGSIYLYRLLALHRRGWPRAAASAPPC